MRPQVEQLESRNLLSLAGTVAVPAGTVQRIVDAQGDISQNGVVKPADIGLDLSALSKGTGHVALLAQGVQNTANGPVAVTVYLQLADYGPDLAGWVVEVPACDPAVPHQFWIDFADANNVPVYEMADGGSTPTLVATAEFLAQLSTAKVGDVLTGETISNGLGVHPAQLAAQNTPANLSLNLTYAGKTYTLASTDSGDTWTLTGLGDPLPPQVGLWQVK